MKYNLSLTAYKMAHATMVSGAGSMRDKAMLAILKTCRVGFTRQEAMDALRNIDLGSGTPSSFTNAFIKTGYFEPAKWLC